MRGKLVRRGVRCRRRRIIPAHAGQTHAGHAAFMFDADHPRACGANRPRNACPSPRRGSSPRMRGKRTAKHQDCDAGRIIPAHAGQTRRSAELRVRTSDHPRACGANRFVSDGLKYVPGSSPRMRGKHVLEQLREVAGRIIPAHAGQTPVMRFMVMVIPDHPRACGANSPILCENS